MLTFDQVFVLPLPLINSMRLSERREKVGLLIVFLLGAITIIVSTARFAAIMMLSNDIMICKLNPLFAFSPTGNYSSWGLKS